MNYKCTNTEEKVIKEIYLSKGYELNDKGDIT
jgi:hypothetical protein